MVWPCLTLNLCIGRAMPYFTLYVFVYMLHCNGRAMPDLKFVCRSGHAWVITITMYVFVYMLHCNGLAMPDLLKFVCRSGHAWLHLVCVCLHSSLQWSGHA